MAPVVRECLVAAGRVGNDRLPDRPASRDAAAGDRLLRDRGGRRPAADATQPDAGRPDGSLHSGPRSDVIQKYQPHCVVAQGDTTTVMAASLVAFYRRIPLVHVEAGLRTGNLLAPWPEELNRRITSLVTAPCTAPQRTERRQNLLSERVDPATVHVTGNTVIDALLWAVDRERANDADWREKYAHAARSPHGADHRPSPRELRPGLSRHLRGDRATGRSISATSSSSIPCT